MSREVHARFWEHAEVRFLCVTRQLQKWPVFYSATSHCVSKRPIWLGDTVAAHMHGDRFALEDNFDPVDMSLRQNLLPK